MRMLVIGAEMKLRREIAALEREGYRAAEVAGACRLGKNVWIFPLEVTTPAED
jgi:hypothetical protein